jgi:hypothetical protein
MKLKTGREVGETTREERFLRGSAKKVFQGSTLTLATGEIK